MSWKADMKLAQSMVGYEVQSLDGVNFIVKEAGVRYGKPAVIGRDCFANPTEVTVLRREDGEVPSLRTADPIMQQIFAIVLARGEITKDRLERWLDADDDNDPTFLYEMHVAPGVNEIEDLVLAAEDDAEPEERPNGLLIGFLWEADGDRVKAGELVGQGLMRGDPAEHKAGYTLPNAMLAVIDLFTMTEGVSELEDDEIKQVESNLRGWQDAREEKDAEALLGGETP